MRVPIQTFIAILIHLTLVGIRAEEEVDPFVDTSPAEEKLESPKKFETTGAVEVNPTDGWNPESIRPEDWPKIDNPTNFNRHFDKPYRIWRVDGGFFGAFDGGEWGGALFFATQDATKWTRIIDTHIQDLERFEGNSFIATGGLAHLSLSGGSAYLVTRSPTGQWNARRVFTSDIGIPRVVGMNMTDAFLEADTKKQIVLGLEYPMGQASFFGVDLTGTVHYLGERAHSKQPSKRGGAGQPATRSESDSEGGDKPQLETEGRPR